ncbi:hypothetical protein [Ligilactobacillus acidipiscis]|uniref:hypothetical protein n=1 Tax=Ligilactobacillus acidipiscis TaxID=89059 RepID=UPI0023F69BE1|nr:hypothetical protein [Ligilactobacillus acidipiscis]WEV56172.1 hypothetical protein OZX66_07905 [Ligilactobacillus acidipiscis]
MKKTIITCMSALTLALILAGCGNNSNNTSKPSGKSARITNTTAGKSKHRAKNETLLKIGQWKNDDNWGKITLEKIVFPKSVIKDGPLEISIDNISLRKVQPHTNDQKQLADYKLKNSKVTSPYYTIHINYAVKNTSNDKVQLNGLKSITTNTGQKIKSNSGLFYGDKATKVAPNTTKGASAEGLVEKGDESKANKITLDFKGSIDTEEPQSTGSAEPMSFNLK